ncbi:hypothetical protein [Paraburkholderia sp.]|uniref:hypothetical protein n=1 Tax=Paraburkholderia sp. TaxID=1926495 RepID=UPI00257AC3C4|nr:hypothetical protein [Paraburkholderia sp.]
MNDRVRKGVFVCLGMLAMTLLAGCGGGSDSSGGSGGSGGPGATPVAASTSVGGTAASRPPRYLKRLDIGGTSTSLGAQPARQ